MNARQLKYFLNLCDTLSFVKTAEMNFISQSAVSQQIKNLETEIQAELFNRSKRKVTLTPAGRVFCREARELLVKLNGSIRRTRTAALKSQMDVSIASPQGLLLPGWDVLLDIKRESPRICIRLERNQAQSLWENLASGQPDLVFVYADPAVPLRLGFKVKVFGTFELTVAVPASHPLAQKQSLTRADFAEGPILYEDAETRPGEFEDDPRPSWGTEADLTSALINVSLGNGFAIVPRFSSEERRRREGWSRDIRFIPLKGERHEVRLCAVWRQEKESELLLQVIGQIYSAALRLIEKSKTSAPAPSRKPSCDPLQGPCSRGA